jgi:GPN-loop GTPase
MGKHAQLVLGPAGAGKSTYVKAISEHCASVGRRSVHCVNLDPAAEVFGYDCSVDIRDLVTVDDVQGELDLGPNGGLVYAIEYAASNMDWLEEEIGDHEDDYLLLDCPGQTELFMHVDAFKRIVHSLQQLGYSVCAVFLIDSQFMMEPGKFISGCLLALSAMCRMELPHINVLSKMDLAKNLSIEPGERVGVTSLFSAGRDRDAGDGSGDEDSDEREGSVDEDRYDRFLTPDVDLLLGSLQDSTPPRLRALNDAIGQLLEEYSMVHFVPLDITSEHSLEFVLSQADNAIQYGEDVEPRLQDFGDDPGMGGGGAEEDIFAALRG